VSAEFIPLADVLRPPPRSAPSAAVVCTSSTASATGNELDEPALDVPVGAGAPTETPDTMTALATAPVAGEQRDGSDDDVAVALREARLFRARLLDAFDDAAARLLRELASTVLARELRSAPCDLAAVIAHVRERAPVVRARVAPDDVPRVTGVPVVADPALACGDAVVELDNGAVDARLGVRLAALLEAFA
jgi:hypothetical protein